MKQLGEKRYQITVNILNVNDLGIMHGFVSEDV